MADNFAKAGMNAKAREYLSKIIDTYGDTDWAAKARADWPRSRLDEPAGDGPQAQTRQLDQYRGDRVERPVATVLLPDDRGRAALREQVSAWESDRDAKQKGVDRQFTTANARIKLKRLCPDRRDAGYSNA